DHRGAGGRARLPRPRGGAHPARTGDGGERLPRAAARATLGVDLLMHQIWPPQRAGELDDEGLERLYTYPSGRWLCVNFVASADGAMVLDGRARGLSNDPDRRVLKLGSDL